MESLLLYTSVTVHLILIFLLWRIIYKKLKPSSARINIAIWVVLIISILYCFIVLSFSENSYNAISENLFVVPALYLGLFLPYIIALNGCYSIILLIRKWINLRPSDKAPAPVRLTIFKDIFQTKSGGILLEITSDLTTTKNISTKDNVVLIRNTHFSIEIISFNGITKWAADSGFPVEDSKGWIIRIVKTSNDISNLRICCELKPDNTVRSTNIDSGEHLDAVCIESETHVLHIGTEDGDLMQSRALNNDYMPLRFSKELGYNSKNISFTHYTDFGFETIVPELTSNENIYFHYLAAINPLKKSKDYPDEEDISTNFAVDFSKKRLIDLLKLKE